MKGTVPFVAEGQGYTLLLDFNALCELSGELPDLMNGGAELKDPRHIRLVFHAALMAKHPDLTVLDAGRIIQAVGIVEAAELLGKAFNASFGEAGEPSENPPKRSRGTGS
jgi:hypothetical protein